MTESAPLADIGPGFLPSPDTPVLLNRKLRDGTDRARLSRFSDSRWDLTPAIFEVDRQTVSINLDLVPATFREIAKHYIWMEINNDHDLPILRRASINGRLAVYTMASQLRNIRALFDWMDAQGVTALNQVTSEDLDGYLSSIRDAELGHGQRCDLLQAVRRLWALRELLPPEGRLPETPPWRGKESRILLERAARDPENRTPRIPETTMSMLLCWAIRFVEDFSTDILAALDEFRLLFGSTRRRAPIEGNSRHAKIKWLTDNVDALLEDFRRRGEPLPGRVAPDGSTQPDWAHLGRLMDFNYQPLAKPGPYQNQILRSGLPVTDAAYLRIIPQGLLDGQPWLRRIRYDHGEQLVRMLNTACLIVICYLSGMRPGEALNLHRGCLTQDRISGLWMVNGRKFKGATDANGAKIPEGQHREDPWVVVDVVARAISIVEQLHDSPLLFPVALLEKHHTDRDGARSTVSATNELNLFIEQVNNFCHEHNRTDTIPVPQQRLNLSRFRRTLAWFICRRPRGLVAAAIQYGHLHTQITQGYSGNYASGFPDDLAFERWLARLDELNDADRQLREGGHVSGPAADAYRSRVTGGAGQFAGRVIRTGRQARHILANPALQIHHGSGMTCVFNSATALCELAPSTDDSISTPDTTDCRGTCRNIARTDADIAELQAQAAEFRTIINDPASPPIRLARERLQLAHLEEIIAEHHSTLHDGSHK